MDELPSVQNNSFHHGDPYHQSDTYYIDYAGFINHSSTAPPLTQEVSEFITILNKIIIPIVFGLITCVGLTGNGLVIYVIVTRERMRTVINLLLLNLAVADFSFVLVIPPSTAYQFADERWHFGAVACKLMHFLVNVTAYVTVYTLVLISLVRYLTVVHNTRSSRFRTKPVIVSLIITIWLVLGSVNTFILFIYDVTETQAGEQNCELRDPQNGKPLFASFFVFGYLFPLAVIAVLSMRIARRVTKNKPMNTAVLRKVRSVRRNKQIGRLLVIVVVLFAVLWLPVHVHLLIVFFGDLPTSETYQVLTLIWYCSAYSNSCVNPIIYHCASKEFRQAFREVVGCQQANGSIPAVTVSHPSGGFGGPGTGGFGVTLVKKVKPVIDGSSLHEDLKISCLMKCDDQNAGRVQMQGGSAFSLPENEGGIGFPRYPQPLLGDGIEPTGRALERVIDLSVVQGSQKPTDI